MSKRSALEHENKSLRDRIARMTDSHRKTINAKNQALAEARLGDVLFEISDTFPSFPALVTQLRGAQLAAAPLRSPTGDGRSTSTPTPLESGASTRRARAQAREINKKLARLVDHLRELVGNPDTSLIEDVYRPQCWNATCPSRGIFQAFDRTECITCDEAFGRYKPLNDLTQLASQRCWTQGCPFRGKTNRCIHSWKKMDVPGSAAAKVNGA